MSGMSRLYYQKPKVETLESLSKKSADIFNIFTKTQKDLEAVNTEITVLAGSKRDQARIILDEATQLEAIAAKNQAIAKKIDSFINN